MPSAPSVRRPPSSKLSARFSYAVEYDSNPPPGAVQTDTLSRVTLIYDF